MTPEQQARLPPCASGSRLAVGSSLHHPDISWCWHSPGRLVWGFLVGSMPSPVVFLRSAYAIWLRGHLLRWPAQLPLLLLEPPLAVLWRATLPGQCPGVRLPTIPPHVSLGHR